MLNFYSTIRYSYLKRPFFVNAFSLYFGRSINLIVGLFSSLIYGIIFQKKEIAIISLYEMVVSLFFEFGFSWSKITLTRFGKEEWKAKKAINYTSSIRIGLIIPVFLFASAIMIIFRKYLLEYINTNEKIIIAYLLIQLILLIIHEHIIYTLVTLEKHMQNVLYYIGQSVGKLLILLSFYYNFSTTVSAELYIKYNVYLLVVLLFIRIWFLDAKYFFPLVIGKLEDYKKYFLFATPMIYGIIGLYIINWVDVYYIKKYCNLDDLGGYQFLYSFFVKISSFAIIFNTLLFPKIMDWKITRNSKLNDFLQKAPIYVLIMTIVIFFLSIIVYPSIFNVFFQNKYQNAYSAFNILLISIPFIFLNYIYIPVLNSHDRVNYLQFVNIISASFNFLIDSVFIKYFGVISAGLGTFFAFFIKYLLLSIKVGKMFNINYKYLHMISTIVLIIVIAYFLNTIIS